MTVTVYNHRPIGNIDALACLLSFSAKELVNTAEQAGSFYTLSKNLQLKPDGTLRITYRVENPLKFIQDRVLHRILYEVEYPRYLLGSIHDEVEPRNYIINASVHSDKTILVREDISNFFPSIDAINVRKMWQYLFHFPADVADILTRLTTYRNAIPQGASTSSYIANLIFWDKEPQLVDELRKRGLSYTRYVDDITVSASRHVAAKELQQVTSKIYGMLFSKGVRPNRRKRAVQTGRRKMTVHKLLVNSDRPTLGRKKLSRIRAAVKQVEDNAMDSLFTEEYEALYKRVFGRVKMMEQMHPKKAKSHLDRLKLIKPMRS